MGCKEHPKHAYGFYFWRTTLALSPTEKQALNKSDVPNLYTRFFDVDKRNGKFEPIGIVSKKQNFSTNKAIVPVVFITNRCFLNIQKEDISFLAKAIADLVVKQEKEFGFKPSKEIQIDCDWTAGTREDYFSFLKTLKQYTHKEITSTLRLHQVKDQHKMGIPPVSKVYLMCYSTSSPLENSDKNSILNIPILKSYLSHFQNYPIRNFDIALPIYSWGIITNHIGKHKLINALTPADLHQKGLKKISENEAIVEEEGFYFGFFLNKGFKIKIETIEKEQLEEVIDFLNKKNPNFNIIYFQLDQAFIKTQNL